jgi:hypothetical protein
MQIWVMKKYVTTVEALIEKIKTSWNLVYHQNWWFSEFHPYIAQFVFFL